MRTLLLASLLLFGIATAQARFGNEAMFGVRWGMTPEEISRAGVSLKKEKQSDVFTIYRTSSLPKNLSDVDFYFLTFANNRLVKVAAVGKTIEGDPLGSEGKARYAALKGALTEKYGTAGETTEIVGAKLYKDSDEFYECLRYAGCGMWATIFKNEDRVVLVEIQGLGRGSGYVTVKAESIPEFGAAADARLRSEAASDKDAL